MKKTYGVVNVDQKEYVKAADQNTGGGHSVERPILKIDAGPEEKGYNNKIVGGIFELPPAAECQEPTLEVAYRILGLLITKDLLVHMPPTTITAEHLGTLVPFYPFAIHRRFGKTYTDRVCPSSTRSSKCAVCDGRVTLFQSDQYKDGRIVKDDIIKNGGFGTRQTALVVARVYFDGEDLGIRVFTTALTNELATSATHDNFFDLVANLTTPKKLIAGETLPLDYYSNGDGARWLVAEYSRAIYTEDAKAAAAKGDQKRKRPPAPYWKLSKITPMKEIKGVGKAEDIWWPEIGKKDSIELLDVLGLLNFTPAEELEAAAKEKVDSLLNPKQRSSAGGERQGEEAGATAAPTHYEPMDAPTWEQMLSMSVDELVVVGGSFGGDTESLALAGSVNVATLRRSVAKLCGVTPKPVTARPTTAAQPEQADPGSEQDEEHLPF